MGKVLLKQITVPLPEHLPLTRDLISLAPWVQRQGNEWVSTLITDGIVPADVRISDWVLPGGAGRTYEAFLYNAAGISVGTISAQFVWDGLKLTYQAIAYQAIV